MNLKKDPTEITALTLIEKAIEYNSLSWITPNYKFKFNRNEPGEFVRLQQLDVLLKIFTPETYTPTNLALSYDELIKGGFIMKRDISVYSEMIKALDEEIIASYPSLARERGWIHFELQYNFARIIGFKQELYKITDFNSSILETSYAFHYASLMTDKIANSIDTQKIDEFLRLTIDPAGRTFTKESLIEEYGYPKEEVKNY